MNEQSLPKYVKVQFTPNHVEWFVRLYDRTMDDPNGGVGDKMQTPQYLYNRFFTARSYPKSTPKLGALFFSYEELQQKEILSQY